MDKIEVTQADRTLYHQLLSLGSVNLNRRRMGLPIVDGFELIAAHRLATRTDATPVAWMPIESAPHDEEILAAIKVRHADGQTRWERHIILIDSETGMIRDVDFYHGWEVQEYTFWQPLPAAPNATYTHPPATDVAALVENGCEMPEVAAMRYIEELRGDLAASVTILCDNEEAWTKDEQMAVEVIAEWTDWLAKRFMGESVIQCLARAIGARRTTLAALKDRTHG